VLAAGKKDREDIQVGVREQPVVRLLSSGFSGAHHRAQMLAAGHAMEMIEAYPSVAGDFLICKKLLTRSDGDHFDPPSLRLDRPFRVPQNCTAHLFRRLQSNSDSVS